MKKEAAYSVLILDDEIMVLRSLEAALKMRGFITRATMDHEEAIRLVESHRPSVACIDLHMPRVNGIDVIEQMRKIMPDIRVIVVTGYTGVCRTNDVRPVLNSSEYRTLEMLVRRARKFVPCVVGHVNEKIRAGPGELS